MTAGIDPAWQLTVSADGRRVGKADAAPWFYLGDTAWDLFTRPTREEVEWYFATRRRQGFSVVQAVALMGYHHPLNEPNVYGHRPLIDADPTRPAAGGDGEDFWTHADFIIDRAAAHGLYVGLLPLWGYHIAGLQGTPVTFTIDSATTYARWIAQRYRDRPNILWINGGDVVGNEHDGADIAVWRAIGRTIKAVCPHHLMTFHPAGTYGSSMCFHGEDWLDFNMIQTGHSAWDLPTDKAIGTDWHLAPTKPTLDGEPPYEEHPVRWDPANGFFGPFDVRQAAYWSVFAGAFGHTYGHVNVWRFNDPAKGRGPDRFEMRDIFWKDGVHAAGADHMTHLRTLMLSRPMDGRVPDPALLADGRDPEAPHQAATRGDGYAMVYSPQGHPITIDADALPWEDPRFWWYDPRTGAAEAIDAPSDGPTHTFDCPGDRGRGCDWVLVIDDARRAFSAPGVL
ncbi:MAG: glycoside hydrolase family 140 protein [Planctomycetota bacterium]